MSTLLAPPRPAATTPLPAPTHTLAAGTADATRIVLHGDFACPWSYLASRRADLLARNGVVVDWRAVEHEPRRPWCADPAARLDRLRTELLAMLAQLLPGETLPARPVGHAPWSRAATSAYAEAYAAGVAPEARRLLFEAFWVHGFDLDDANGVRALLTDLVRGSGSPSEVVREWGNVPDVTGGPVSTTAWRLLRTWREEWQEESRHLAGVPTLQVDGAPPVTGVEAVRWLGDALRARGIAPDEQDAPRTQPGRVATADLHWVSRLGEPFHRDQQRRALRRPWEHDRDGG